MTLLPLPSRGFLFLYLTNTIQFMNKNIGTNNKKFRKENTKLLVKQESIPLLELIENAIVCSYDYRTNSYI